MIWVHRDWNFTLFTPFVSSEMLVQPHAPLGYPSQCFLYPILLSSFHSYFPSATAVFLHFPWQCRDFSTWLLCFDYSHPSACEVVSHGGFELHFSNDSWCWASSHTHVHHLYSLLGLIFFSLIFSHHALPPPRHRICFGPGHQKLHCVKSRGLSQFSSPWTSQQQWTYPCLNPSLHLAFITHHSFPPNQWQCPCCLYSFLFLFLQSLHSGIF